ncbi:hypothetical protein M8542_31430 [Amycolatopsis sp. OK19-0408]|uniref:Uncharacterized protein n=1 Tax=Amycolatopsis iheyensis TaxID=2945988 RepID=A0A9X2NEM0_9PSEU|nr:hypothetical protein [Amycolatopsis iheyensis]MCR6487351.1 hypothetical protein [Amycolatopsis iheyensis]
MELFWVGLGLFAAGAILNAAGWQWHRRAKRGIDAGLLKWLVGVLSEWFGMLTGPDHTGGQRLAAFGSILSAVGLVLAIVGIGVWATA